jgi:hypothetical protein
LGAKIGELVFSEDRNGGNSLGRSSASQGFNTSGGRRGGGGGIRRRRGRNKKEKKEEELRNYSIPKKDSVLWNEFSILKCPHSKILAH